MPEAGHLHARFDAENGMTRLRELSCRAPLKIAKPFAQPGGALRVCAMDSSPGLLEGDSYEFAWRLEVGARVHGTTQGFTRVHPCGAAGATLQQRAWVGRGARLELFPEPTLLFQGAALRTRTEIEIEDGGALLLCDITGAGRMARGEAWAFRTFDARLRVLCNGEIACCAATRLCPQQHDPRTRGAWGDATHWGSFYAFGKGANQELRDALRRTLDEFPMLQSGASLAARYGVVVSLLGRRACDLQSAAAALRQTACAALDA